MHGKYQITENIIDFKEKKQGDRDDAQEITSTLKIYFIENK